MKLKNLLKGGFKKKRPPVPEITIENSPVEIDYVRKKKYVTSIDVSRCRTNIMGRSLVESPFVAFLKEYETGKVTTYKGSLLERFYNEVQPKSMCEVLGLDGGPFQDVHAMATIMPWWDLTPDNCLPQRAVDVNATDLLGKEAVSNGLKEKDNFGWQHFGPISDEVGELEFQRLVTVYKSIKEKGYITRGSVPINGEFLVTDSDWAWTGLGGKHRMTSLVALGWERIPVTTKGRYGAPIVKAAEVDSWPNVRNGLFTRDQALTVFSHISGIEI